MARNNIEIECPDCGEMIDINEQISHRLKEEFADERKQLEVELRKELHASHSNEIDELKAGLAKKEKLLLDNKNAEDAKDLQLQEMQHQLENHQQKMDVERQKAALEAKKEAMKEYKKMAEEMAEQKNAIAEEKNLKLSMKINELQDQQRQMLETHREQLRIAEQGSMQRQGEGAEIFIEEGLIQAFPSDEIREVPKGTKGADVIQTVKFGSGIDAGIIVWESKRAQNWSNKWISKVKEDTTRVNGHISVIVSDALPSGITRMKMIEENVWVCKFSEYDSLAVALRQGLIQTETVVKSQEGKGSKMERLYEYMTSQQFGNAMRMIDDSYIAELDIIAKERRSSERNWSAREKAAEARRKGFSEFFGTVKSIHTDLPAIKEIEAADEKALLGSGESTEED